MLQTQGTQWQSSHAKTIQGQKKTGAATLPSATAETATTRKRLSIAQNPSSASKKATTAKTAAKRASQVDTVAGNVPNAFDLMLQSDFSVDYMMSDPLMFS